MYESLAILAREKQRSESKARQYTKTGVDRTLVVPFWARPHLDALEARRKHGPLFIGVKGWALKYTSKLNEVWQEVHRRLDLPYRVAYACRHTSAAEILSRGVDPAEAANELGHSTDTFLKRYSEFIKEYGDDRDWSRDVTINRV